MSDRPVLDHALRATHVRRRDIVARVGHVPYVPDEVPALVDAAGNHARASSGGHDGDVESAVGQGVDSRELKNHPRLGMLLAMRGVVYESRQLALSDALFVLDAPCGGGCATSGAASRVELMMQYVMERKEIEDFMSSLYDGRYREQKHRLLQQKVV